MNAQRALSRLTRGGDAFLASLYSQLSEETRDKIRGWAIILAIAGGAFTAAHTSWFSVRHVSASTAHPPAAVSTPAGTLARAIQGVRCIDSYSNLEDEIYSGLSRQRQMFLLSQKCSVQRRVLDYLTRYPRDRRDEVLANLEDAATRAP